MNATPAVSQTPIASDPAQLSSTASANSINSGGKGGDFAAALSKAGAKPARKPVPSAPGKGPAGIGPDGGQLPVAGNPSPPPNTNVAASDDAGINAIGGGATQSVSAGGAAEAGAGGAAGVGGAAMTPAEAKAAEAAGSAPGAQVAQAAPDSARAGEHGAQGADNAALAGAGSAGAAPAGAGPAAATQDSRIAPTSASVQATTVSGGTSVGMRASAATSAFAAGAASAAKDAATSAGSGATGDAAAQANAAVSDPTSLGATAAVMAAVTGAVGDNSTTADATLSPAADLAASAGSTAAAAVANGAPGPGIPVVAGRLPAAAAAPSVTAASTAALITASAGATAADKRARSDAGDSLLSAGSDGSAGAAQLSAAATPGAVDGASAATLKLTAGVDSPEFGQGLADRLSWMVDNNVSSAKLQVNPPQLGPIEVRISVQGDHAQVWLVSHSAVTRDALQSSSPNLREMLGAQGFGQVSVDISQRNFQDRSAYAQPYERTPAAMTASAPAITAVAASLPRLSSGAVDAYA